MKKIILAALLALSVAGCQHGEQQVGPPQLAAVPVPTPQPVSMRDVNFKVYNTKELEKLIATAKKNGTDKQLTVIALTPKGYENMSLNLNELERYIREQKEVIVYLKNVVDSRGSNVR
ncbi:MAG: hypothetical protein EOP84_35830 [Verrucomicrobiaceae bacterium]|nr:MAG: hypothetical protein EOP84_35830 [Verrucomicrobiaceae bacterium]